MRKRYDRLVALEAVHDRTCKVRRHLAQGRWPKNVVIRADFIYQDGEPATGGKPPITRLLTPHGIALQTYLVALFEAQCRHGEAQVPVNGRVLLGTERGQIGWLDLIATNATAHPTSSVERATEQDNRLRQLKSALRVLEREKLITISESSGKNGRYERFSLSHESGISDVTVPNFYAVPTRVAASTVVLPLDFFLRGWNHVLSPSEVAMYLLVRHLSQAYPQKHEEVGVYITGDARERHYGLSRDVYEAHRTLADWGLIQKISSGERWPDGKVKNYQSRINKREWIAPHRFKVVDESRLRKNALKVVRSRIEEKLARHGILPS